METSIALAAWDGGKGEINGKKAVSTWVTLKIEGPPAAIEQVVSAPQPPAAPVTRQEIIVRRDLPGSTMIIIGASFLVLLVFASWLSWVFARRS